MDNWLAKEVPVPGVHLESAPVCSVAEQSGSVNNLTVQIHYQLCHRRELILWLHWFQN